MVEQVSLDTLNSDPNLNLCSNLYFNFFSEFAEEYNISCTYHSESSSINNLKSTKSINPDDFIVMSMNCQSYLSKKSEILNLLDNYKTNNVAPSVVCFQESWFQKNTNFDLLSVNNYKWHYRSRKGRGGGGVATLVQDIFSSEEIFADLFLENIFESLILKISYGNFSCISINFYRPPRDINNVHNDSLDNSNEITLFLDRFSELLHRLDNFTCPIFMCGDHNLNLFSCNIKTSNSCAFFEQLIFSGFLNLTYKATRITQYSHTLIDFIAVKNCLSNIKCNQILISDISDHLILVSSFSTSKLKKPTPSPFFSKRLLGEENISNFREALRLTNWDEVHSQTDVNNAYSLFISKFLQLYDIYCPLIKIKLNRKKMPQQPHMNDLLLRCRNFKDYLFRLKNIEKTQESHERYKNYRNQYNRAVRRAKINDYHSRIRAAGSDSKKMWNCIKSVIGLKKEQNPVEYIEVNNERISGSKNIANCFNSYFSSLGEQLTPNIPTTNQSFREFLPPPCPNSIFVEPLYPVKVFNLIKSIKPKMSTDNDGLSMFLISSVAEGICAPLSSIYNLSIESGVFPDKLKISKTIIIHKGGSLSLMDCFRGVSLIPTLSKPLERYIFQTVYSFLDSNNFWSPRQFGFRPKYSTIHNALDLYNLVTETLAAGRSCLSIFVDIQKCFDMVDREVLLSKFENCGIRGTLLKWFKSYYSNRRQRVFFGGEFSTNIKDIIIGILQGSILGIISFLVMINDLVLAIPPAIVDLFADDSQLFLAADNLEQLVEITRNCLPKIVSWYSSNRLLIHPNKTKILIYSTPLQRYSLEEQLIRNDLPLFIDLNNQNESDPNKISKICLVPNANENFIKHLGLIIDEKFSFQYHFIKLYNTLQKSIFTLKQMKNILDCRHLKLLYHSYIKSHLEYGIILFTACPLNIINPIIKLQKLCIRIIDKNKDFRAHTAPLFKKHKILPYQKLLDYNCLIFMHRYKHNKCPEIFRDKWTLQANNHTYNTRNRNDFEHITHNRNFIFNAPLYYLPRKFNQLPLHLKCIENENEFSRKVFDHLLNSIIF